MSLRITNNYKYLAKDSEIESLSKIDFVEIPLKVYTDISCKPLVKKGDSVKIGTILSKSIVFEDFPIYSSVSGKVDSIEDKTLSNGKIVSIVRIQNNNKDEYESEFLSEGKDTPLSLSKEELYEKLKQYSIIGLGGSGFPTYIKYKSNNTKSVFLNGVESEPYVVADYTVMKNYTSEVVEGLKLFMKASDAKKGYIVIKSYNKNIIKLFKSTLKTNNKKKFNIKLCVLRDNYKLGWENSLVSRVLKKDLKYKKLYEEGIIVNNVSTAYHFYNSIKNNKPLTSRYITISGQNVIRPANFIYRNGTLLNDLINHIGEINNIEKATITKAGPMMGTVLKDTNISITLEDGLILISEPSIYNSTPCMKCGRCVNNCPVGIQPNLIGYSFKTKKFDNFKTLKPELCVECASCSYICPARLELTDVIKKSKIFRLNQLNKEASKKVK